MTYLFFDSEVTLIFISHTDQFPKMLNPRSDAFFGMDNPGVDTAPPREHLLLLA